MSTAENSPARVFATQVVQRLRDGGFTAYFAGGCVRDQLLGVTPKDYDVATDAKPQQVRDTFGPRRTIAIGASFGVITVLGPKAAGQVEVATFRSDGSYGDGRHPDHVTFSSPQEDAQRRDFTINGMFFDPLSGQVIDFVGGQADLQNRVIRAIGDPLQRIAEDKLRMLRAVRFTATYGFELEKQTLMAIRQQHTTLSVVSVERITSELERMLCHPNRCLALHLLSQSRLLPEVLPEIGKLFDEQTEQPARLLQILDALAEPDFATLLASLLGAAGASVGTKTVEAVCRRMKISNVARKKTIWMVQHEPLLRRADELRFSQLQPLLIAPDIHAALELSAAIVQATDTSAAGLQRCHEALRLPPEHLNPAPWIRGEDLLALGAKRGPALAHVLRVVRSAQLDGLVEDKDAALMLARKELAEAPD